MDCSLSGSSVHGILQAKILEWVAISFCQGSSRPRDRTWVSRIAGRLFTIWVTRESQINQNSNLSSLLTSSVTFSFLNFGFLLPWILSAPTLKVYWEDKAHVSTWYIVNTRFLWVHIELPVSTIKTSLCPLNLSHWFVFLISVQNFTLHAKLTFTYGVPPCESPSEALACGNLLPTQVLSSKALSLPLRPCHLKPEEMPSQWS